MADKQATPKQPATAQQLYARLKAVGERAGWQVYGGTVGERVEIAFEPAPKQDEPAQE